MKRMIDITGSLFLCILLSPILLIIFILIRLNMGRPVLFKQIRPGINGQLFTVMKFRTMQIALDKKGQPLPDFNRLTTLGAFLRKSSLDELPQLFNVLKGDMSFVGPRPLLIEYLPLYNKQQARRHKVKPGITGWAQVNGRNAISWEEKFKLDVWYVDNQSLLLDAKILWLTLLKVVQSQNVNQSQHTTMEKFTGTKSE